ncbi:MAG: NAD(P)/FAD-dependent oxidoreductase [Thermoleophilaceae bacterium]
MEKIVVVGAGLAGLRAAEELRDLEFAGELTVVGEEEHAPYNRPPLSKQVLAGDMEPDDCLFGTDDDVDITWRLGSPAKGLDIEERTVALDDGEELSYDGLVIATGRRAREWPDLPDLEGFHTLRTLDDSIALRDKVAADSPRVAIIGAGFIGCEVAATLRRRGLEEVALIDVAPYPMPVLGAQVGERAAQLHTDEGVKLHLEAGVEGFEGSDRVEAVCLEDGTRVDADLVIIAIGSVANSDWLKDSGLEFEAGAVLCDACCVAKGTTDVVAAGRHRRVAPPPRRRPHLDRALEQRGGDGARGGQEPPGRSRRADPLRPGADLLVRPVLDLDQVGRPLRARQRRVGGRGGPRAVEGDHRGPPRRRAGGRGDVEPEQGLHRLHEAAEEGAGGRG